MPLLTLSFLFMEEDIRSCRGAVMGFDVVKYLYETHLISAVEVKKINY